MVSFTKRQWLTIVVMSIADFCNAICVSLQAPFYPKEAEKKGASASEYGLVFGIFELVVFVISPLYGAHLNKFGPKLLFNAGIYTTGICAILFGLLDKVEDHYPFIVLSFVIRIVEAMGNAAFLTASFAIIAKEFPNNIATAFASLETFFGLGLIVGPTVGGALYEVGGYTLPFVVMGTALFFSAILTKLVLPHHDPCEDGEKGPSIFKALKIPGVLLAATSVTVTSMSIGFLHATLEPHLRQFQFKPIVMGMMFVISGAVYALSAPLCGWVCDRTQTPKFVTLVGTVFVAAGFFLIGPAPCIPTKTLLWLSILGLVLHGLGLAAQLVSSFTDALRTTIANGFENNLETFGLISGLWTSTFALGAFIGPSVAGILYDNVGFRWGSMFIVAVHLIVFVLLIIFLVVTRKSVPYVELAEEKIANGEAGLLRSNQHKDMDESGRQSRNGIRNLNGISIEKSRPPGLNSLIACNSYKSQAWQQRSDNHSLNTGYSLSYGATNLPGYWNPDHGNHSNHYRDYVPSRNAQSVAC